jgi:circadian clock protein KaiC
MSNTVRQSSAPHGGTDRELPPNSTLAKSRTGIGGLDEITGGGLPRGRTSLVCGSAGSGKTLLAVEFLVRGATEMDEPGVFVAFEETAEELAQNVRSLGFDLEALAAEKKIFVDYVHIDANEIEESGDYDLDGLFIRLGYAIDSIGAKRVVLDTIEVLFGGMSNQRILRSELRRLFRWLKDRGVTAIVTGERGDGALTRQGIEEYVSDCVILLDHRVTEQVSTRRLRIVKYRGTTHGTNEYPFLIDESGISVLPITSPSLQQVASDQRLSSGVEELDAMLGGHGYYRGSSVLVSGTAGTGKTSLAAHFVDSACRRGERSLYFAFEEGRGPFVRNMRSIGLDLEQWIRQDLLRFHASRPEQYGLEMHLAMMHKEIERFAPSVMVVDPVSNLTSAGTLADSRALLTRLFDFLKARQITLLMTNLSSGGRDAAEVTEVGISSLVDTWLLLRDIELNGERNRGIYVLKSRGTAHSNQIREFLLTDHGIELKPVYLGSEGVLTGSARIAQEARERAEAALRRRRLDQSRRQRERERAAVEAQIAALRAKLEEDEREMELETSEEQAVDVLLADQRSSMARSRGSQPRPPGTPRSGKRTSP